MPIRHILVPLSPAAATANFVGEALSLAKLFGARVTLLNVVPSLTESAAADWNAVLESCLPLSRALEIAAIQVEDSNPARKIALIAQEKNVDLIVMTSDDKWREGSGISGARRFTRFTGLSTLAKVLDTATAPVWISYQARPGAFRLERALCYLSAVKKQGAVLQFAQQFGRDAKVEVSAVHLIPDYEVNTKGGSQWGRQANASFQQVAAGKIEALQGAAGTHFDLAVEIGDGPHALSGAASKTGADLVIASHRPSWMDDGQTFKLIRNIDRAVLVCRDTSDVWPPLRGSEADAQNASGPENQTGAGKIQDVAAKSLVKILLVLLAWFILRRFI